MHCAPRVRHRHRAQKPTRRESARGAASLTSSFSLLLPPLFYLFRFPYLVFIIFSTPVFSFHSVARDRSLGSILRQPFWYFFRIARARALQLVESEDSQRPIEITRPDVFRPCAYRMLHRRSKAQETFRNPFVEHCCFVRRSGNVGFFLFEIPGKKV